MAFLGDRTYDLTIARNGEDPRISSMNVRNLIKLGKMADEWGGMVVRDESLFRRSEQAPFTSDRLGILWDEKVVVYADKVNWTAVLHEMGHVFATPYHPINDETLFFGWEFLIAEKLGGEKVWMAANKEYGVPNTESEIGGDFGDLSEEQKYDFIEDRIRAGVVNGIIVDREPVSIR